MSGPPRKILLATDLSPRCDRAQDRAIALAAQWQSDLFVLHVLEEFAAGFVDAAGPLPSWRRPRDPAGLAAEYLKSELGALAEHGRVLIGAGEPAREIQRTAEAQGCELIVTGTARDELFGRFGLGTTVDRLLRRARIPVLVVKNRARKPYDRIVVATDFSVPSLRALETALQYFPFQTPMLFHAYDAPMSGLTGNAAAYRREYRQVAEEQCVAFLRSSPDVERAMQNAERLIEFGAPDELLRDCAQHRNMDLVVLGTRGRSALADIFVGSVARTIMESLPCDALVVPDPGAPRENAG